MNAREKILIIRLKSIGDILFTLPAVHVVRQNFPEATLHFLVSREFVPLLRGFAEIDEVIGFDRAAFRSRNFLKTVPQLFRFVRGLRGKNFSLVVDFQGYGETAWLSWLSDAPGRWGSIYRFGRNWAYTQGEWRDHALPQAEWNLALLQRCGLRIGDVRNEFVLPADAMEEARKFFAQNGLDEKKPTLFIQPFTSTPSHNWPLENFLAIARHFRPQIQIIFGGGPSEREALKPVLNAGFVVSAGTPLLVSAGLAKFSSLVVGGDTGLLHLAVALGKHVVMLMPNHGTLTRPFRHQNWAVEPPEGKTVASIPVEKVVEVCAGALA